MQTIREDVEDFLSGERRHRLPVPGIWSDGNRDGEYRMVLPIEVAGEIGNFELQLISAPDSAEPGLRIVLRYGRAFWRLCMAHYEHVNSFNRPADLPAVVSGPHHHSWHDNRMMGPPGSLPTKLRNARALPPEITTDELAFRWFLAQVNIEDPDWDMPEWPKRTRLL